MWFSVAESPPSSVTTVPLTEDAEAESKNDTVSTAASVRTSRPIGIRLSAGLPPALQKYRAPPGIQPAQARKGTGGGTPSGQLHGKASGTEPRRPAWRPSVTPLSLQPGTRRRWMETNTQRPNRRASMERPTARTRRATQADIHGGPFHNRFRRGSGNQAFEARMHQVDQMGGRFTEQPPASFRQAFRFIEGKAGESPASPQRASPSDERQTESVFAPSSRRARANAIPSWLLPPRNDDRPFEKQLHASPRAGSAATRSVPSAIRRSPDSKTHRIAAASS